MQEQGFYNENKVEHLNLKLPKININETILIVLEIFRFKWNNKMKGHYQVKRKS